MFVCLLACSRVIIIACVCVCGVSDFNSPSYTVCMSTIMSLRSFGDVIQNYNAGDKVHRLPRGQHVQVSPTVASSVTIAASSGSRNTGWIIVVFLSWYYSPHKFLVSSALASFKTFKLNNTSSNVEKAIVKTKSQNGINIINIIALNFMVMFYVHIGM